MISLVIDQSQPGVFYLQKMMHFMKPGVFHLQKMMNFTKPGALYLQKMMSFMKPGVFYLQKMLNFMKMRTIYKKIPLFIKNSILHTYKKLKPQIWAFIKKTPFLELLETPVRLLFLCSSRMKTLNLSRFLFSGTRNIIFRKLKLGHDNPEIANLSSKVSFLLTYVFLPTEQAGTNIC